MEGTMEEVDIMFTVEADITVQAEVVAAEVEVEVVVAEVEGEVEAEAAEGG